MFLEISQNSQGNTCARISFLIKLQAFCYRTPLVAASDKRNIKTYAIEMQKVSKEGFLLWKLFNFCGETGYDLWKFSDDCNLTDIERVSFVGPKIWEMIAENMKKPESLNSFKKEIKYWKRNNCPCRLWKIYIRNDGFLAWFLS